MTEFGIDIFRHAGNADNCRQFIDLSRAERILRATVHPGIEVIR